MTDEELLQRELRWTRPSTAEERRRSRPPPGYNVMVALSGVIFLVALGLVSRTWDRSGQSDSAVIKALLSAAAAFVFGIVSGRWLWKAIGPVARTVLRPLGFLGAGLPLIVFVVGLAVFSALLYPTVQALSDKASALSAPTPFVSGPRDGPGYAVLTAEDGGLIDANVEEGRALCAAKGPGWRLPKKSDGPFLTESVHLAELRYGAPILAEEEDTGGQTMGKFTWNPSMNAFWAGFVPDPGELPRFRGRVVCVNR